MKKSRDEEINVSYLYDDLRDFLSAIELIEDQYPTVARLLMMRLFLLLSDPGVEKSER